jgi:hypothetical protein
MQCISREVENVFINISVGQPTSLPARLRSAEATELDCLRKDAMSYDSLNRH